jgi:hypothetical protein
MGYSDELLPLLSSLSSLAIPMVANKLSPPVSPQKLASKLSVGAILLGLFLLILLGLAIFFLVKALLPKEKMDDIESEEECDCGCHEEEHEDHVESFTEFETK